MFQFTVQAFCKAQDSKYDAKLKMYKREKENKMFYLYQLDSKVIFNNFKILRKNK